MKKILSIIVIIALAVFILLLFMPFILEHRAVNINKNNISSIFKSEYTNFFSWNFENVDNFYPMPHLKNYEDTGFLNILSILTVIFPVSGIVGLIMQYKSPEIKFAKIMTVLPIASFVTSILSLILARRVNESSGLIIDYVPYAGFYLEAFLILASSVLCFLITFAKISDTEQNKPAASVQNSADEMIKYKELLDSGTITQEEFDEKKKQLLGL